MTLLAYIGPGKGFSAAGGGPWWITAIAFALIALVTWWAMWGMGR